MAKRKPVPSPTTNLLPNVATLSNPAPLSTDKMSSASDELRPLRACRPSKENDSGGQNAWASGALRDSETMQVPLECRDGNRMEHLHDSKDIPESVRLEASGITPHSSTGAERPKLQPTNPYVRRQLSGQNASSEGKEIGVNVWGGPSEGSLQRLDTPPPPPLPKDTPPEEKFANLSVLGPSTQPWQPPVDSKSQYQIPNFSNHEQDRGNEAWSSITTQSKISHPIPTLPPEESQIWEEESGRAVLQELPSDSKPLRERGEGHNIYEESGTSTLMAQQVAQEGYFQKETDLQPQESGIVFKIDDISEYRPLLPARPSTEPHAPPFPPRPPQEGTPPVNLPHPVNTADSASLSNQDPSRAGARQRTETYDIKKATWYDATASSNPRISPILVQNANGPCPLLALVNALCLSTPAELNTALVETLRSREQVSLGLLLDAVFDELMSGRRGGAAQELPDVGDLYAFLITLHTGMNVNPRFFSSPTSLMDDAVSQVHPIEHDDALPGTFEATREMTLYSTFNIPLIHGWLPARNTPAYAALARSAKSYEDAQNLMFREEELEDKLRREGLAFEEQATLEDIATIKAFFAEHATQLTPHGLETIRHSITPGSVAILFRNDHFSTLYRHPETYQLLHLVTDMGYARHEEIVWESLADVSGENSEFFSGDFRIVGGTHENDSEWTTISSERGHNEKPLQSHSIGDNPVTTNEQEDHDLALALQLQDEEEERHRNEISKRRREAELSQQYIEQQASRNVPANQGGGVAGGRDRGVRVTQGTRPSIPPRRNNAPTTNTPVVDHEAGVDAPPPTYEQAATAPVYNPPPSHPAHPNSSRRQSSAYNSNAATYVTPTPANSRPRDARSSTLSSRSSGLVNDARNARRSSCTQPQQQDREKDCIVM